MSSPSEVAGVVIGGLIALAGDRADILDPLAGVVARAVDELDPGGVRDTDRTWYADLPSWFHLDAFDRFRKSYEDLVIIEGQAEDVVGELRAMLSPSPVGRHRHYRACHQDLVMYARQRGDALHRMRLAVRRLRAGVVVVPAGPRVRLSVSTTSELRRAINRLGDFEAAETERRDRLGRLLSMSDLVAS